MTLSLITGSLALVVLVAAAPAFAGQQSIPSVEQHVIVTANATGVPFEQVTRSVEVIARRAERTAAGRVDRRRPAPGRGRRRTGARCRWCPGRLQHPWRFVRADAGAGRRPADQRRAVRSSQQRHPCGAGSGRADRDPAGRGIELPPRGRVRRTINVITRAVRGADARIGGGQSGLVDGSALATLKAGATAHVVAVEGSHSDGFMVQRGYHVATVGFAARCRRTRGSLPD